MFATPESRFLPTGKAKAAKKGFLGMGAKVRMDPFACIR